MDPGKLSILDIGLLESHRNLIYNHRTTGSPMRVLHNLSNGDDSLGEWRRRVDLIIILLIGVAETDSVVTQTSLRKRRKVAILEL
jgi:hypothetical protein